MSSTSSRSATHDYQQSRPGFQLSVAGLAGVAAAGVLLAHVGLRPLQWRYEWLLSTWQYSFSVVMLGPLLSGFCAWAAASMAAARPAIEAAGRVPAVLVRVVAETSRWALAVFTAGYLLVMATTAMTSSPGALQVMDVIPIIAPLAGLVFFCVLGAAVGWRAPHVATAPLLALAVFGVGVIIYGTRLSFLIDVGGASGSLVGLAANGQRIVLQVAFYALAGTAAVLSAPRDPFAGRRRRRVQRAAIGGTVLLLALGVLWDPPRLIADTTTEMACGQADPVAPLVCLGPGYADRVGALSAALAEPLAKAVTAGAALPDRFDQRPGIPGVAVVDPHMLSQGPDAPAQLVANALLGPGCAQVMTAQVINDFTGMAWWLATPEARPLISDPSHLPAPLRGTEEEQLDWARTAVKNLASCSSA